ncbi:hypothetical protein TrVE_jg9574 [Triparma verrucosa]|uniref:Uncharacterized protein n=1 Tax=Triparma verrucosa TaxID=1606542 RepID=A0A9W7EWU4_9STRA|nr:hypothetical protein TrVE_jg9574 [Triparma verrucosa]
MKQAYTNATRQNKGAFAMAGSSGASKKVKMPLCTYGSACTRGKACVYRHPSKKSSTSSGNAARAPAPPAKVCLAHLAGTCTFGSRCFNRHPSEKESEELRKGYKQKKCLYGDDCRSMGCLYFHPREEEVDEEVLKMAAKLQLEEEAALLKCTVVPNLPIHPPTPLLPNPTSFTPFQEWLQSGCAVPTNDYWFNPDQSQRDPQAVYDALCRDSAPQIVKTVDVAAAPPPTGWAAVAAKAPPIPPPPLPTAQTAPPPAPTRSAPKIVPIAPEVWNANPSPSCYNIPDPLARYTAVNTPPHGPITPTFSSPCVKIDLHYQSQSTFSTVLDSVLPPALKLGGEVWIITGRGNHVNSNSFQQRGGILFEAVKSYVEEHNHRYALGKGGGAILLY